MLYQNQHKKLISVYLEVSPQLEKWEARVLANRKIGKELLQKKSLKDEVKMEIQKSEFVAMSELRALKTKIKTAQKA